MIPRPYFQNRQQVYATIQKVFNSMFPKLALGNIHGVAGFNFQPKVPEQFRIKFTILGPKPTSPGRLPWQKKQESADPRRELLSLVCVNFSQDGYTPTSMTFDYYHVEKSGYLLLTQVAMALKNELGTEYKFNLVDHEKHWETI